MTDQSNLLLYWKITKNIYYSSLFILPMLFLYELMCWIQFAGTSVGFRNGADILLRQLIMGYGKHSESLYALTLFIVFLGTMFYNRNVVKKGRLKFTFLLFMFVESLFWSLGFIILMIPIPPINCVKLRQNKSP